MVDFAQSTTDDKLESPCNTRPSIETDGTSQYSKLSKALSTVLSLRLYPSPKLDKSQYNPISGTFQNNFYDDDDDTKRSRSILGIWKIIISLFALWGSIDLLHRSWQALQSGERISCNCGNSTAEAIALGCKFELMSGAWLPNECRDDELAEEFNHAGPGQNGSWGYYDHRNDGRLLSANEVAEYADRPSERYWTTFDWHLAHCNFYWRKQYRSQLTGKKVDLRHDTEAHIIHCGNMVFKERPVGNQVVTHNGVALNLDMTEIEEAKFRGLPLAPIKPGN